MAEWMIRSKRRKSGALRRTLRRSKKKAYQRGGFFAETKVAEKRRFKKVRGMGGNIKIKLEHADFANVIDKNGKAVKVKIKAVTENTANRHYVRRNIITKGSIIETEIGLAKVTSRPGQDGVVNAVIVE